METRRFGRTEHLSTVAIFGAFAISKATQTEADAVMEQVIAAGVNHIDVAPSYGLAEERLGPWMARERERFFLGCKTMERTKEGAAAELRASLERLQVEAFDLYQIHAISTFEELDEVTRRGGALEALVDAQNKGLVRFLGITGHGLEIPAIFLEALNRYDFASVLFPVNFILYANRRYREEAQELLQQCRARDVGIMSIKAIARGPWGEQLQRYNTWYEPFTGPTQIQTAVDFTLSQEVTGLCTAGDASILPLLLRACEEYVPMDSEAQEALISSATQFQPLFA